MLCDCHMHTSFSGDSDTPPEAQFDRCLSLGMTEMCVTDHHDYDAYSPEGTLDFILDMDSYLPAMERYRERYAGRLQINIGVELGLMLHLKDYLADFAAKYRERTDFFIGSSHFVDGMDIYYPDYFERNPDPDRRAAEKERYLHYFEVTAKRIEAIDCFDSFGHLDFVLRYGPHKNRYFVFAEYREVIDTVLQALIRRDKALEVNTGGYKYGMGQPNPGPEILSRYRELGGRLITVGSDAHVPGYVGYEFERTAALLRSCGFTEYAVYRKHAPQLMPL